MGVLYGTGAEASVDTQASHFSNGCAVATGMPVLTQHLADSGHGQGSEGHLGSVLLPC